jgi:hypothetical protein
VEEKKNDLRERLFEFAVRVIEFLKILPTFLKIKLFFYNYPEVLSHAERIIHPVKFDLVESLNPGHQKLILQIKSGF